MKQITMRIWTVLLSILILVPQGTVLHAQEDLPEDGTPAVVEEDTTTVETVEETSDTEDTQEAEEPEVPQEPRDPDPEEPQEPAEPQ